MQRDARKSAIGQRKTVRLNLADVHRSHIRAGGRCCRAMTRTLLCDDRALVRAGFRALLEQVEGFEVVGEAATAGRGLSALVTRVKFCLDSFAPMQTLNLRFLLADAEGDIARQLDKVLRTRRFECCSNPGGPAPCVLHSLNDQERPMHTSKVSSKWQVVIPRHVREAEQIRVGSEVTFERTAEGILLRPVGAGKRVAPEAGYGILKTRRRAATEADIARAVRSAVARKEHKRRTSR